MFLQRVAQAFYAEYGADIRRFTFVFPNRRAGLFFRKYLVEELRRPIFAPEIITISDCFLRASGRMPADRIAELFRLYRIYRQMGRSSEPFDAFVFWGEMLLADFDEVDKSLVDASKLFKNVGALKAIDWADEYISETQREAIRRFWDHFMPSPGSKTKEEFIAIWKLLLPLYEQFHSELEADNIATEGMIYAAVARQLQNGDMPDYLAGKSFVFIGFNALNRCERTLFEELRKRDMADFYWDYESPRLQDPENPAAYFYTENTTHFHSKLTINPPAVSAGRPRIRLVGIPSAVGQAKEVYNILSTLYPPQQPADDPIKTAVVLPDERLLPPLLHSLPAHIGKVNVTMGFPLKTTPVAGLVEHIFELHRRVNAKGLFYHKPVADILNHQYLRALCPVEAEAVYRQMVQTNAAYLPETFFHTHELLALIFAPGQQAVGFADYLLRVLEALHAALQQLADEQNAYRLDSGYLLQYYTVIEGVGKVMKKYAEPGFEMNLDTLARLIRRLVEGATIPFDGEPLDGLQVMGVLETRGLDFENLIVCSFNEGLFPKKSASGSFIPHQLRTAFELPTPRMHDAVAAYNFYRLLQRARNVYFLYDSRTEGMQTGEVSRYAYQLEYLYGASIERINLSYNVAPTPEHPLAVSKTPEVMDKLRRFLAADDTARHLSASAINTYIQCPLQFYFSIVERMAEPDEVQEKVESAMFGTLLHYVMEVLYKPFEGRVLDKPALDALRKNDPLLEQTITQAFGVKFFNKTSAASAADVELAGGNLLTAKVLKKFVAQILKRDAQAAPFRYVCAEKRITLPYPIDSQRKVNLKGVIDRVDEPVNGLTRILDYKTGRDTLEFKTLDELFDRSRKERPKAVLQTFFYSLLYTHTTNIHDVSPEVMKIRDLFKSDFTTRLVDKTAGEPVAGFAHYRADFEQRLTFLLAEIFDPAIPFVQTPDTTPCVWCPFQSICRRC